MKYSDKPQYQHDCDKCKFLGHVNDKDLYFCEAGALHKDGTIILRNSSEGYDYHSGLVFSQECYFNEVANNESDEHFINLLVMREAFLRAITRGYITPDADILKR